MNSTAKLQALKQKFQQEKAKILIEAEIESQLPKLSCQHRTFVRKNEVWLTYRTKNLADVAALGEGLPPVPAVLTRGAFTAIKRRSEVLAMSKEQRARAHNRGELNIVPFWLTTQTNKDPEATAKFMWFSAIGTKKLRVKVQLPWRLTHLNRVKVTYGGPKHATHGHHCRIHIDPKIQSLFGSCGNRIAELGSPVQWATGDTKHPNDFTLYWIRTGNDRFCPDHAPTLSDLIFNLLN